MIERDGGHGPDWDNMAMEPVRAAGEHDGVRANIEP